MPSHVVQDNDTWSPVQRHPNNMDPCHFQYRIPIHAAHHHRTTKRILHVKHYHHAIKKDSKCSHRCGRQRDQKRSIQQKYHRDNAYKVTKTTKTKQSTSLKQVNPSGTSLTKVKHFLKCMIRCNVRVAANIQILKVPPSWFVIA